MTKLQTYLASRDIKQAEFAALVGTTQATISRLAKGPTKPSLTLAIAIERVTKGKVPADSWVDGQP